MPKIAAPTSVAATNPRPKGRGALTGGGSLAMIAAVAALISWLVYYRPVSADGLNPQQVVSLTQFQPPAPVHGLGTQQGLLGLGAAVALVIAAALLMAGRRIFVVLAALASGILLTDGLSAVQAATRAADSWTNLVSQLVQIETSSGSGGPLGGVAASVLGTLDAAVANAGSTVTSHSVIPSAVVVAAGVIGLLGSLIALVGAVRRQQPASVTGQPGALRGTAGVRAPSALRQPMPGGSSAAGFSGAQAQRMTACNDCGTALHPEDDFCVGCGRPAVLRAEQ